MPPLTYFITGANRGIGLEFVKQLSERNSLVIAGVRDPGKAEKDLKGIAPAITIVPVDVSDPRSIDGLGKAVGDRPIDVLINNAGVGSESKTLAATTAEELARVFQINAYAPILVTKALLPNLRSGARKLVVQITSQLASIATNTGSSSYAYRGSKTALNQMNKSLAVELAPDGITCVAVHPGWVRTDMGGPNATLGPAEAVGHMLRALDRLTAGDTGKFLNYDGTPLPW